MSRPPLNPVIAKDVLFEVADILDECGLPFFLICGTALGAHRDKGFAPSDNDIDLGYLIEDMTGNVDSITSGFESAGFGVSHVLQGTTDKRETRAFCVDKNGVHVDLVGWSKNRNDRYIMASSKNRALVHPAKVIENPSPVVMFGRTFMMPSPHETYLRHEYGADFMTPKPDYHKSSSRINNYKPDEIDIKSLLKRDVGSAHLDKIYSSDDICIESKGHYPTIGEENRLEIVQNVKGVDSAFIYRNHFYEGFIGPKNYQVLAWNEANEEPRHLAFLEYCKRNGIKIVPIPRTPGVSSTEIKADISHTCRFMGACNA